jgi:phosphoserine phosphatase RsbU/P
MLRRGSGGIERLDAGGVPLGVLAAARYEQGEVILHSSDLVVVFTDGVVEAESEREEEYGEGRLLEVVKVTQPVPGCTFAEGRNLVSRYVRWGHALTR